MGRVYYVGQSGQLDSRAHSHLVKIIQDEENYNKNKLYWLLGKLRQCKVGLHCYALEEYFPWDGIDIKAREKENIRLLKPVLNTQVPSDCVCYMRSINNAAQAAAQADENGRWDFDGCRRLW